VHLVGCVIGIHEKYGVAIYKKSNIEIYNEL